MLWFTVELYVKQKTGVESYIEFCDCLCCLAVFYFSFCFTCTTVSEGKKIMSLVLKEMNLWLVWELSACGEGSLEDIGKCWDRMERSSRLCLSKANEREFLVLKTGPFSWKLVSITHVFI